MTGGLQVSTSEYRPPPEPPPDVRLPPRQWAQENLFNTWYNTLLTLLLAPALAWLIFSLLRFVFVTGRWEIVRVNLTTFMVGLFPRDQLWRPWLALAILAVTVGLGLAVTARASREAAEAKGVPLDQPWHEPLRRAGPLVALVLVFVAFVRTATPLVLLTGVVALGAAAYLAGKRVPPATRRWVNVGVVVGLGLAYLAITQLGGV
ncbi:MAG TPA: hypothetical protein VM287_06975, partial [Egibacteraceae bacterium]|nr:hypothetical protein [Egibacteraceae bacterium]